MGGGIAGQQRGGLLLRARLPQAVQQAGHAARVVEGGVGGGPVGQRGGLLVRARLPQAVQQPGHGVRVVEGGVGGGRGPARRPARARPPPAGCPAGWPRRQGGRGGVGGGPAGQRGGLLVRARLPQAVQQAGHGARVVEGDVGGGITGQQRGDLLAARPPPAGCPAGWPRRPGRRGRRGRRDRGPAARRPARCAPASRRLSSSRATPSGLSRAAWAAGSRASSAAACSLRARLPQAAQQDGHAARVVEGGVGGGPVRGAGVSAQAGRRDG